MEKVPFGPVSTATPAAPLGAVREARRCRPSALRRGLALAVACGGTHLAYHAASHAASASTEAVLAQTDWAAKAQALMQSSAQLAAQQAWQARGGGSAPSAAAPRVDIRLGEPDPRLQLAACQGVEVYVPAGHKAWGQTRVGVRCSQGPGRWNITVPLQISVWAPAWRARSGLPTGTVLGVEHLEQAEADWSAADSLPHASRDMLLGRTLLRSVAAGHTLRDNDLKRRQWFAAGDVIKVVASGPGYRVAAAATALTPGFEGQPARARTEAGRVVTGTATADRLLELPL